MGSRMGVGSKSKGGSRASGPSGMSAVGDSEMLRKEMVAIEKMKAKQQKEVD